MAGAFSAADFGTPGSPKPGAAGEQWSADDFAPNNLATNPMSGAANDSIWSSMKSAGARVLDAMGYGAKQGWGAEPLGLSPETEKFFRQTGLFRDYEDGHQGFLKAFNDATIRPVTELAIRSAGYGLDAITRAGSAAISAVGTGAEQGAREAQSSDFAMGRYVAAPALGAISEGAGFLAAGGVPEIGMPLAERAFSAEGRAAAREAASSESVITANRARAAGVVGEGEAGFYEATPLTPENIQARATAAAEAGLDWAPKPIPPAPDIHELARRIDPETFERYDGLAMDRDRYRSEIQRLQDERANTPEAITARNDLADILGIEHEEPIEATMSRENAFRASASEAQISRLDEAMDRLEHALSSDTPEQAALRSKLIGIDYELRQMAPQVSEAYRHATDMLPEGVMEAAAEAKAAEKPGAAEKSAAGLKGAEGAPEAAGQPETRVLPPEAASEVAAAETAPPNVLGGETLGEPAPGMVRMYRGGSPKEEGRGGWYTSSQQYAEGLAKQNGGDLWYADIPRDHPVFDREVEGQGPEQGFTFSGDFTPEEAQGRKVGTQVEGAAATAKPAGRPITANMKSIEGTGELKTRSLAEGVEAKAIEDGLTETFGDLPEYRALSMAEQAQGVSKLIAEDYERARAIAMGERQPPKGLLPESVFVGVEKHALATGDVETLRQLGTRSRLATAATTMGQRIRALGERDKASPVGMIQEVQTAREAALKAKNIDIEAEKASIASEIKAEMKKVATVKADAWESFISAIKCDI